MPAPDLSRIPPFYHNYIRQVAADSLSDAVSGRFRELISMLRDLDEETWSHAYAPGKWTLKELVQHIMDTERIFSYRALCIARRDPHPLPGFDENAYAAHSFANGRAGVEIFEELLSLDASSRCLFASFNTEQLASEGISNGAPITVNGIGYIMAGHALHHTRIIRERYLDAGYVHID